MNTCHRTREHTYEFKTKHPFAFRSSKHFACFASLPLPTEPLDFHFINPRSVKVYRYSPPPVSQAQHISHRYSIQRSNTTHSVFFLVSGNHHRCIVIRKRINTFSSFARLEGIVWNTQFLPNCVLCFLITITKRSSC